MNKEKSLDITQQIKKHYEKSGMAIMKRSQAAHRTYTRDTSVGIQLSKYLLVVQIRMVMGGMVLL